MTTHFYATYEKDMLSPATTRVQRNKGSPEGSTKSTPTSSNDLREHGIEPTEDVAEWCHQMHITQRRQYGGVLAVYRKVRLFMCRHSRRFTVRTAAVDLDTPISEIRCLRRRGHDHQTLYDQKGKLRRNERGRTPSNRCKTICKAEAFQNRDNLLHLEAAVVPMKSGARGCRLET